VSEADLILHGARPSAHEESDNQALDVEAVLSISASTHSPRRHIIEVWNKIDYLSPRAAGSDQRRAVGRAQADWCRLRRAKGSTPAHTIDARLGHADAIVELSSGARGRLVDWLTRRARCSRARISTRAR